MTAKESVCKAQAFGPLTPKMAWQLAAPHTWPASIMPALVATAAAYHETGTLSVMMTIALLVIVVLMQAAVNTINDYFDYMKGTDSAEDNVDPTDAVLVYNNVNPKHALALAVGMLVAAFALGAYAIIVAGWIPLAIGVVGAIIVFLYSGGKTPISYLPIGEFVSGFVMGGLIPLAIYQVLTRQLDFIALVWAIPLIINIGLIMLTNNTCDIEKDIEAGRRTLPVIIKRDKSRALYHALLVVSILVIAANLFIWFTPGVIIVPFMLLASYPFLNVLWKNPLAANTRIAAMSQICMVNVALGTFYALGIFASAGMTLQL